MSIFDQLRAEFPRNAVSWRAQSLNKEGTAAMALAYIDARDVMNRLDDVLGPDGWQCRYPHANGKTVCEIGIRVGEEWIWKADGAGDSDIEAEKGALSDAFKRAAVRWGIGRYLYDLDSPWVDCEHYTNHQGKKVWKRWTQDPWAKVKNSPSVPMTGRNAAGAGTLRTQEEPAETHSEAYKIALATLKLSRSKAEVKDWWEKNKANIGKTLSDAEIDILVGERNTLGFTLPAVFQEAAE